MGKLSYISAGNSVYWIIDQYRVKTDKYSGITNDHNREDDPEYIVKLIKKIITKGIDTVWIVIYYRNCIENRDNLNPSFSNRH